jgi:Mrp family chromosome partitioning ATPase
MGPAIPDLTPVRFSPEPAPRGAIGGRGGLAPPESDGANDWDEPPSLIVPARSLVPVLEELTLSAPIATLVRAGEERAVARAAASDRPRSNGIGDPERPRTLPDLDISGIAQLLEEGHQQGFDDTLETNRPTVARPTREFDGIVRGRTPSDEPPGQKRPTPTPANGRRRAEAPTALDPGKSGRLSRILVDADGDGDEPQARTSLRPSSSPPALGRSDKSMIAVRPLPAPEVLDKRLVMLTDPFSTQADAYRALRRKLAGPGAPRTIAVTSALPDEGKTSCAVNLALAFRETSSERVLLLEANLRAPALAKLFGFEPPVCFAKQMAKNRDTARASWTVVEQFEPLHVLAVDPSSKTSPLLDPVAFANALEQLVEAGYDHIIVDTPPALGGSDVNLIADAVDGIVVVAWIKKSKKSQVKKAIEQLRPATILGVVTLEG